MDDTDETQIQAQAWPAPLRMLWEALERYQEMVVRDPNLASKLEAAFRVGSYIIPGKGGGGPVGRGWILHECTYLVYGGTYCIYRIIWLISAYQLIGGYWLADQEP